MPSNYDQGTTTTHTTLQVSQSLFDLVVTEISARNEIPIQSLLRISGYLIYSLRAWASCELSAIMLFMAIDTKFRELELSIWKAFDRKYSSCIRL